MNPVGRGVPLPLTPFGLLSGNGGVYELVDVFGAGARFVEVLVLHDDGDTVRLLLIPQPPIPRRIQRIATSGSGGQESKEC